MFHLHKWETISARPVFVRDAWGGESNCTNILVRCIKCGDTKVKRINGTWTIEEIKGLNFETELLRVHSGEE